MSGATIADSFDLAASAHHPTGRSVAVSTACAAGSRRTGRTTRETPRPIAQFNRLPSRSDRSVRTSAITISPSVNR